MLQHYRFGNERVASEIALPGLIVSNAGLPAAITVRRKLRENVRPEPSHPTAQQIRFNPGALRIRRWRSADGAWLYLRYGYREHFAEFGIGQDGREVRAHASGEITDGDLASLLEGAILGGALRLLGNVCLHATVLTVENRAVALMGQSGAGKSSLAWALLEQGCRLLSDDFAAFSHSDNLLFVQPGRTKLRLWPDVAERVRVGSGSLERLYPLVPELKKLVATDPEIIERNPTQLHAIYLLNRRDARIDMPLIEDMPPGEQLVALAANLYGVIAPGAEGRRKELAALAHVAACVRVCRLTLPDNLDQLSRAAEQLRLRLFD